ncbi:probable mediator of RNA polymerase II transcription subunit 36b isoform X2 [Eutrema salsugineum]|uniref:probable mediator of RNA polymerase II transcription subunit 36b isoform X2 n=1 Tax=Eutrema salsugineum TaxID=72664 RepID=UPI000CECE73B|nr:probable mediator of RNA polymerase II transcription subunit 36b isoform X2 [Eutrema salsugineum]
MCCDRRISVQNEDGTKTETGGTTVSHVSDLVGPVFLKTGGHFVISIKANCSDSTVPAEAVFQSEVKKLQQEEYKPAEQVTLEPYKLVDALMITYTRVGGS